ncbi:hypothetical protein ABN235_18830 [Morganella morganii]|uniref:hypothetical protein n=1 Tax=Morganella morganii TaxID=582 RepID=UPI0032DA217D
MNNYAFALSLSLSYENNQPRQDKKDKGTKHVLEYYTFETIVLKEKKKKRIK